ncbi:MAG: hypothetical protein ACRDOD_11995 [Streptosporangiaceae bacterium]
MPAALTELETGWTVGGYSGFSLDRGSWPAISSAGNALAGATPTSWTGDPAHWQAMQRMDRQGQVACQGKPSARARHRSPAGKVAP